MPTRAAEGNGGGVGEAAKRVADHAKALAGLEVELAAHEMKRKAGALGVGVGMLVGAAVVGGFGVGFLLATPAAGARDFLAPRPPALPAGAGAPAAARGAP